MGSQNPKSTFLFLVWSITGRFPAGGYCRDDARNTHLKVGKKFESVAYKFFWPYAAISRIVYKEQYVRLLRQRARGSLLSFCSFISEFMGSFLSLNKRWVFRRSCFYSCLGPQIFVFLPTNHNKFPVFNIERIHVRQFSILI